MTNEEARVRFGAEVRRRRESVGMTLDVLAARAGLTPNYVGGVEMGKREPSLSTMLGLAIGLGIRAAELFSSNPDLSPASDEAGHLFDLTEPDIQEAVLQILRAHAEPTDAPSPRKPRKPRKA
jgi:transcriptional regulator with XRE-family HTH domain